MPGHSGRNTAVNKPRYKTTAEDQEAAYRNLLRNQSQKAVYEFIVSNFDGQGGRDLQPDSADISNVRYLLLLVTAAADRPSSELFVACTLYFQRSNVEYMQKLRVLEQTASDKLIHEG